MEVNCRSFEYFPEQGGHQRLLEGRESERKGEREWERGREREVCQDSKDQVLLRIFPFGIGAQTEFINVII